MKVSVKKYKDPAKPKLKWVVAVNAPEGRARKFFETKGKADAFAQVKRLESEEIGNRASELDERTKRDALDAKKRLPAGRRIKDAVDFYIQHLKDTERSCDVNEAAEEFLAFKEAKGKSHYYLIDLRSRLKAFREAFGGHVVAEITPKMIEGWLAGLKVGKVSLNNSRRVVGVFFGYCLKQGLCRENPIRRVEVADVEKKDVEIYSPADMALLLDEAQGDVLAFLAIGGFGGLRAEEVKRLNWEDVKRDRGIIDLSGRITKTAASRAVTILPVLAHYLEAFAFEKGPVCKAGFERRLRMFKAKMGKPVEGVRRAIPWERNALRHSFATYFYCLNDAGKTAKELGHNGTSLLQKHYRKARVTDADARAWFNLHLKTEGVAEFKAAKEANA
jgi:integrase